MKKVLYVITSPAHKRVFESFVERPDLEQFVIGPKPNVSRFVPEDYSDFKLKVETFDEKKSFDDIKKYVNKIKPDIYVQPDLTEIHNKIFNNYKSTFSKAYKRVYVSHGMIGNHVIGLAKKESFNLSVWKGLNLYCGADKIFEQWVKYAVGDKETLLNTLPQMDILYNSDYYNSYRKKIMLQTKMPTGSKAILFIGFEGKDRADFKEHNEDYFRTAIELGKIAKNNNWIVFIKPRQEHHRIMNFLQSKKWRKLYEIEYNKLLSNPHIHFIGPASAHIYRYYFADAFIINGCTTAEIEACAIQKPLFVVRTNLNCIKSGYDPYQTVSSGAARIIHDLTELENDLVECFGKGKYHWPEKQKQLIKDMGISFDGKHHERIQNKLAEL